MARDSCGARARGSWRSGAAASRRSTALKATAHLAIYPVLAIVAFFFHSWFTTGAWFVTAGFFVPDNVATGNLWAAFMAVVYGMRMLIGTPFVLLALAGVLLVLSRGLSRAEHAASLVVLALVALTGAARVCLLQRPSRSGCATWLRRRSARRCLPASRSAC